MIGFWGSAESQLEVERSKKEINFVPLYYIVLTVYLILLTRYTIVYLMTKKSIFSHLKRLISILTLLLWLNIYFAGFERYCLHFEIRLVVHNICLWLARSLLGQNWERLGPGLWCGAWCNFRVKCFVCSTEGFIRSPHEKPLRSSLSP